MGSREKIAWLHTYYQYQDAISYEIATLHADQGEQGAIAYHQYQEPIPDEIATLHADKGE